MKTKGLLVLLVAAAAIGIAASQALSASTATTWTVDKTTGTNNCAGNICKKIQKAVDKASPGDKIVVHDGTYNENVLITTNDLTLKGGTRAALVTSCSATKATSPTKDTVVDGTGGDYAFDIEADNVSVSGFVFTNTTPGKWGVVVDLIGQNADYSGFTFQKNVFENMAPNTTALFLSSNGSNASLVQSNCFRNNAEDAIFSGWSNNDTLNNVTIQGNKFLNNANGDMLLVNPAQQDISITGNISNGGGLFVSLLNTSNFTITGNITKTNATPAVSGEPGAIYIGGNNTNGTISGNIVQNAADSGLVFDSTYTPGFPNSALKVANNIVSYSGDDGVVVVASSLDDSTFSGNIVKTTTGDNGIFVDTDNTGNTFSGNIFQGLNFGCHDDSSGSGTSFTANTWGDSNIGKPHNSPIDICFPHK